MDYPRSLFILRLTILVAMALILAACAAPAVTGSPVAETSEASPAVTPTTEVVPTPTADVGSPVEPTTEPTAETGDLRPLPIEAVQVEIGVGSPIPVEAVAIGIWPDLCAQLAEIRNIPSEDGFAFTVMAAPPERDCPPDAVGLPVRLALPLNMAEMPPGTYRVSVNGVEAGFDWLQAGQVQRPQTAPEAADLRPIPVEVVSVEVGVGSPIPVEVLVSGTWPDLCAQLAEVRQTFGDSAVEIELLATPEDPACPPDRLGLPFRIVIPLNMVQKSTGPYSLVVNGVEAGFEWTGAGGEVPEGANPLGAPVAYIGEDGNIWLLDADGEIRQVTQDASPQSADPEAGESISYWNLSLSPDAALLAFQKDVTTPVESGLRYESSLWVHDTATGEARILVDRIPAGFAWKPASHVLAYGLGLDESYFSAASEAERAELATGIWAVDLQDGEPEELVQPERGFTLMFPVWSGDGQLISFQEVYNLEGCGWFAYYDFGAQDYVSWDDLIGFYSWSPDASQIAYDRLCYVPTGEERIYLRDRQAGAERRVSADIEQGFAFRPVIAPQGDAVAYLVGEAGTDSQIYRLYIQALPEGEARPLGQYEAVSNLNWSPDGQLLVFSAGPHEGQQVLAVRITDGSLFELARGSMPDLAIP